jgi:hypothetical protein
MGNIHDNGPRGAGRNSTADNEAVKKTFHLAVNVQVHASPAHSHKRLTLPVSTFKDNITCC